jgi:hypothetical protein
MGACGFWRAEPAIRSIESRADSDSERARLTAPGTRHPGTGCALSAFVVDPWSKTQPRDSGRDAHSSRCHNSVA